jgi:hypothetical protein
MMRKSTATTFSTDSAKEFTEYEFWGAGWLVGVFPPFIACSKEFT